MRVKHDPMSNQFEEFFDFALMNLMEHFEGNVTIRLKEPDLPGIDPMHAELVEVNGFSDPWQYHEKVALDTSHLRFLLAEMAPGLKPKQMAALFDEVYETIPAVPVHFMFGSLFTTGSEQSPFDTRCIFCRTNLNVLNPEVMPVEDGESYLPDDVAAQIQALIWPYAQVAFSNLGALNHQMRLLAMAHYRGSRRGIPANQSAIRKLNLPSLGQESDGPAEAERHTIAIPFPSAR